MYIYSMEKNLQGTLSNIPFTLYTCPNGVTSKVASLEFNNPLAYIITLEKYSASLAITTVIYNLTFDAGDFLIDNGLYFMEPGDSLIVTSSIVGTTYLIYLVEY
jgi:hypothetical protein